MWMMPWLPPFNLEVEQMNVKMAFLHGDLKEEIYIKLQHVLQI
jgi:hypothetical protein